jgi:PAS domain S-box-containing protein
VPTSDTQSDERGRPAEPRDAVVSDSLIDPRATVAALSTDVVTCRGSDGTYSYVSSSVESVLGWRVDEIIGQTPKMLWHPDDLPRGKALCAAARPGEIVTIEWRARRRDGSYVWCESRGCSVEDPTSGELTYWGALRDVSERRRSEERYRLIADLFPEPVLVHDRGVIVYANPALAALAGVGSPQDLLGQALESFVAPQIAANAIAVCEGAETVHTEFNLRNRGGSSFVELEVSAAPFPLEGRTGALVVLRDVTALRHAAGALAASEARYHELVDHLSGTAVFLYDCELNLVMAAGPDLNGGGRDIAETIRDNERRVLESPVGQQFREAVRRVLLGEPSTLECEASDDRHYTIDLIPLTSAQGDVEGIQVVARDATGLRRVERKAHAASVRYATAMASAPVGIAHLAIDRKLVRVNRAMCEMLGRTEEQLLTRSFTANCDPADRARTEATLASILDAPDREVRLEIRLRNSDDEVVWVLINGIVVDDEHGHPEHMIVFVTDISERVRSEQLIRESEERFRVLAEAASEGVCIGENGVVLSANPAMARMFGYEPHELPGLEVEALLAPESRPIVRRNITGQRDVIAEFVGLRRDGSRFPIATVTRTAHYRGRKVRVTTVTDLTAHKRSAALEERRRIARDLHDGLAHELSFVASHAKNLKAAGLDEQVLAELVGAAERAVDEARRAITVLSSPCHEPFGVALSQTAEELTSRHGLHLRLDIQHELEVPADAAENVLRIVREAITNAARHGGATTVAVSGWCDGALHLAIEDDGCGFTPTTSRRGFGLVSMKERSQAVGATFSLHSLPGAGTKIELVFG